MSNQQVYVSRHIQVPATAGLVAAASLFAYVARAPQLQPGHVLSAGLAVVSLLLAGRAWRTSRVSQGLAGVTVHTFFRRRVRLPWAEVSDFEVQARRTLTDQVVHTLAISLTDGSQRPFSAISAITQPGHGSPLDKAAAELNALVAATRSTTSRAHQAAAKAARFPIPRQAAPVAAPASSADQPAARPASGSALRPSPDAKPDPVPQQSATRVEPSASTLGMTPDVPQRHG